MLCYILNKPGRPAAISIRACNKWGEKGRQIDRSRPNGCPEAVRRRLSHTTDPVACVEARKSDSSKNRSLFSKPRNSHSEPSHRQLPSGVELSRIQSRRKHSKQVISRASAGIEKQRRFAESGNDCRFSTQGQKKM